MRLLVYLKDRYYSAEKAGAYHYLFAANGTFLVKENLAFKAVVSVDPHTELGLHDQEEVVQWKLPKIPFATVQRAINFFRLVRKYPGTEAFLRIYYCPADSTFCVVVPEQVASSGSVSEIGAGTGPEGYFLVCTMHSHPCGAFHSSTDQQSEASLDGMHITVGNLDEPIPDFDIEIVAKGRRFMKNPEEVMDYEFKVSEEWLVKVHRQGVFAAGFKRLFSRGREGANV
jgi:hypothetical protein